MMKKALTLEDLTAIGGVNYALEFTRLIKQSVSPVAEENDAAAHVLGVVQIARSEGIVGLEMMRQIAKMTENRIIKDPSLYTRIANFHDAAKKALTQKSEAKLKRQEDETPKAESSPESSVVSEMVENEGVGLLATTVHPEDLWQRNCAARRAMELFSETRRTREDHFSESKSRRINKVQFDNSWDSWADTATSSELGWAFDEQVDGFLLIPKV